MSGFTRVPGCGPAEAKILIVGEAPGADETYRGQPFVGVSGHELTRMLTEAGINRAECWVTNCVKHRPPNNDIDAWIPSTKKAQLEYRQFLFGCGVHHYVVEGWQELQAEINAIRPNIIIGLGNTPLWMFTQNRGILKWRGSLLEIEILGNKYKFIPTVHPAAVLREWQLRSYGVFDLRRAKRESGDACYIAPDYKFITRPSFDETLRVLDFLQHRPVLSCDIETASGQMSCIGFGWSDSEAICIPFHSETPTIHYWTEAEEIEVVRRIVSLLRREDCIFIGQNFLYDCQYLAKQWGVTPQHVIDTMILQHALLPGLPKGLGFISSLHCKNHVYWKEEGKTKDKGWTPDKFWAYNAKDCVATFEAAHSLKRALASAGLTEVADFQMSLFHRALKMMLRGVRVDRERRAEMKWELEKARDSRLAFLERICGHPLNPSSPKQIMSFFYNDLGIPPAISRKTHNPTMDDDALERVGRKEPLWLPLVRAIQELRSIKVFLGTFIEAPLDSDGRMRSSINVAGTETFRFTMSENAFGSGLNFQTIPKGVKLKNIKTGVTSNGGSNNSTSKSP